MRFRAHRGAGHARAFRAHKASLVRRAFAAHAARALRASKARNVRLAPAKVKAAKFKSALPSAPAAWTAKKRRVAKYRAARPGKA